MNYKDENQTENFNQKNERSLSEVLSEVLTEKDYVKVLPLIQYFEKNEKLTPKEAEIIIEKSAATIRRYLKILVDAGVIYVEGSTNNVIYVKK